MLLENKSEQCPYFYLLLMEWDGHFEQKLWTRPSLVSLSIAGPSYILLAVDTYVDFSTGCNGGVVWFLKSCLPGLITRLTS